MRHLLVVEDNIDAAALLHDQAEIYGVSVVVVQDRFDRLIDDIEDGVYADVGVAVVDFMLPGLTGGEVATALRAHTDAYVVGATALGNSMRFGQALTARDVVGAPGMSEYLEQCHEVWHKPVPMSRLRELLR